MDIFEALRIKIRGDNPPDANKLLQPDKEVGHSSTANPVELHPSFPHMKVAAPPCPALPRPAPPSLPRLPSVA